MMTTKVQLDFSAINLLFPEGSEQRIEITNAVAAEVTRKMFANNIEEKVTRSFTEFEKFVEKIEKQAMKVYGQDDGNTWMNNPNRQPTERLKIIIEQTVKDQLTHQIALSAKSIITSRVQELISAYMDSGKIDELANSYIDSIVHSKVKQIAREKLSRLSIEDLI